MLRWELLWGQQWEAVNILKMFERLWVVMFGKNKGYREKEEIIENDNAEEDDFGGKTVKKRLRIRLTDEEYRLLLKLKAKKKSAQQQQ